MLVTTVLAGKLAQLEQVTLAPSSKENVLVI
jgi:hypothetical protein